MSVSKVRRKLLQVAANVRRTKAQLDGLLPFLRQQNIVHEALFDQIYQRDRGTFYRPGWDELADSLSYLADNLEDVADEGDVQAFETYKGFEHLIKRWPAGDII